MGNVDVGVRVRVYMEDARKFLKEASREFEDGVRTGDLIKVRDAAEKAWNAVVQATNALILALTGKVPASHWERSALRELEKVNEELERLGFRDRYGARERYLHETVFYEGIVNVEDVRYELEKVRKYLDDVEDVLAKAGLMK